MRVFHFKVKGLFFYGGKILWETQTIVDIFLLKNNPEKDGMASHIKTVHQVGLDLDSRFSNVFPCENCPSKFTHERDLVKHFHLYHEEKHIVICERCKRPYDAGPIRNKAWSFFKRFNNIKIKMLNFKIKRNPQTLIRRFPGERKSCSCLQRGTEKEKEKIGDYVCECGKSFSYERYLRRHQRLCSIVEI